MIAPVYCKLYMTMEKTANRCGYCLALHGSMARDLDLLAVPWVDDCCTPQELVDALVKKHKLKWAGDRPTDKPHGRVAYSLFLDTYNGYYFDLSIMPMKKLEE